MSVEGGAVGGAEEWLGEMTLKREEEERQKHR